MVSSRFSKYNVLVVDFSPMGSAEVNVMAFALALTVYFPLPSDAAFVLLLSVRTESGFAFVRVRIHQ